MVRTKSAILRGSPGTYEIVDVDLDDPRSDEITVRMVAAGLCRSDDHAAAGEIPIGEFPFCGGHEGSGVVTAVGSAGNGFEVGDHVVFSFVPTCGQCRWCSSGHQNLCDIGATMLQGTRFSDPESYRMHLSDGTPIGQMNGISTFSEYTTVDVRSAVKVDPTLPLEPLCLLGCGVGTGWGSSVNSADVRPGDVVIVMGIGGIGINAVQGAAKAGAGHVLAVDPVPFKRERAIAFGATSAYASIDEAADAARALTNGQGADSAVVCVGLTTGDRIAEAFSSIRKAGTVVVTGASAEANIPVPIIELIFYQKRIQGSLFGECNPRSDIVRQTEMYRHGDLLLDELITRRYRLDDINQGFLDMREGRNLRGILIFN